MRSFMLAISVLILVGCNSVYLKPNTLDKTQTVYADRGGYTMARAIKEQMEKRGYNVVVGKAKSNTKNNASDISIDTSTIPKDARYVVKVNERKEAFWPAWCALNGMWWWQFNVSIADQKTDKELLTWSGHGCKNSSVRKLNQILDELEKE